MKSKSLNKKLNLKKKTISNLSDCEIRKLRGGADNTYWPRCTARCITGGETNC